MGSVELLPFGTTPGTGEMTPNGKLEFEKSSVVNNVHGSVVPAGTAGNVVVATDTSGTDSPAEGLAPAFVVVVMAGNSGSRVVAALDEDPEQPTSPTAAKPTIVFRHVQHDRRRVGKLP